LIGLTTIFITVFNAIIDSGFSQAVIRKKDATNDDYNTMFITNMVLSVVMFFVLFFGAPAIAHFFERTELVSLTRVMGVMFIVSIILANLLSPDDYGLLGLIAVFTAVCQALINGGFTTALIRKKDATDDDYNTVFILILLVN
jgi:O-antigen/teichoic acid export membrane protein